MFGGRWHNTGVYKEAHVSGHYIVKLFHFSGT